RSEVDILILAHHGADCDTNSKKFFRTIKPIVAICSSQYGNQFDHPRQCVSDSLYELDIPKFTTKTGDVVISSISGHRGIFQVDNYKSNSSEISSSRKFEAKKRRLLSNNSDTIRNNYSSKFRLK
ncbi:MAG: hypothetical protein KGO49_15055, partial [Gammaproteobacteria bacterium]|nr:hypothetical protein [Gammaproteobacteria bacterium]